MGSTLLQESAMEISACNASGNITRDWSLCSSSLLSLNTQGTTFVTGFALLALLWRCVDGADTVKKSNLFVSCRSGDVHCTTASPVTVFLSDVCVKHNMGFAHPEAPDRISHLISLARGNWTHTFGKNLRILEPNVDATYEQLRRVHTMTHLRSLQLAFEEADKANSSVLLDRGDTEVFPGTQGAVMRAAGLVIAAVGEVLRPSGISKRAFVMIRPPGHHAEPAAAMGFCFVNNVMVGVAHAEEFYGIKRVAILDFDVHHGNGDEAMCDGHTSRLYASSHQVPLFPGTGSMKGRSGAKRNIINVPLPPGAGSAEFRAAWRDDILPAVREFSPDMVFLSAGFDGHAADPLASLELEADDFAWVTRAILEASGDVPVVSVLEGGYDIDALGTSAHAHVEALVNT